MKKVLILLTFLLLFAPMFLFAKVNINTADEATLAKEIKGVGPKLAKAIVDYRTENGEFKSINDLTKVSGIGKKLLAKISQNISLNDEDESTQDDKKEPSEKGKKLGKLKNKKE